MADRSWDLGRFAKTAAFFEAIPLLGNAPWLQTLLGMPTPPPAMARCRGTAIVLGSETPLGAALMDRLQQAGYGLGTPTLPNLQAIVCCDGGETASDLFAATCQEMWQRAAVPLGRGPLVMDFTDPTPDIGALWGALDDVVMGGVSESGLRLTRHEAIFTGTVSTANSGGFASIRTRNLTPPLDLSAATGVVLRLRGDGQRYKFLLRDESRWDGTAYSFSFDTDRDREIEVRVPFADCIPVFRARTVRDGRSLDTRRICSLQFMLSKFEYDGALNPHFIPGSFALYLADIRTYGAPPTPRLLAVTAPNSPLERHVRESGLPFAIVRLKDVTTEAPLLPPSDLATLCLQLLQSPQACGQTLEVALEYSP